MHHCARHVDQQSHKYEMGDLNRVARYYHLTPCPLYLLQVLSFGVLYMCFYNHRKTEVFCGAERPNLKKSIKFGQIKSVGQKRWVILSSQEPTEVQISKLKLKLYRKKSEMNFSYCIDTKDTQNCTKYQEI